MPSTLNIPSALVPLILGGLWIVAIAMGLGRVWAHESEPGAAASAPTRWPGRVAAVAVDSERSRPTLVLFAHPRCPCTRATIGELAKLMARCDGRIDARVLFVRPQRWPARSSAGALWDSAAAIPGVSVSEVGAEANARFGARTSGQALLYSTTGQLLFAGGITASRGHSGDNSGSDTIEALVMNPLQAPTARAAPAVRTAPVYGCVLQDPAACVSAPPSVPEECHAR